MKNKYLTYTLEELLDDQSFRRYLFHGEDREPWEELQKASPLFSEKVRQARKLLAVIQVSDLSLSPEEKTSIWKAVEHFETEERRKSSNRAMFRFFRYAALFFLMVSVGTALWHYLQKEEVPEFKFAETTTPDQGGNTRLILHSGKEIALVSENSSIKVMDSGKIEINEEQVVDLQEHKPSQPLAMNEVVVPYGRRSRLELPDGTMVWLNAGSRLAFPSEFLDKTREVHVEGEAYFEVVRKESQPFVVNARELSVKVLGTRFNISAYASDNIIATVLLEGKVSLMERKSGNHAPKEIPLEISQMASYDKSERRIAIQHVPSPELYTAWVSGLFQFRQQSVAEVLRSIERYYNVEIEMGKEMNFAQLISGKLDLKDSPEQVIRAISDIAGFDYRLDGRKILINNPKKRTR
jgi:ferric-dicitrate binding protein FerR (iron transport regulator)